MPTPEPNLPPLELAQAGMPRAPVPSSATASAKDEICQLPHYRCERPEIFLPSGVASFPAVTSKIREIVDSLVIELTEPPHTGRVRHPGLPDYPSYETDFDPEVTGISLSAANYFKVNDIFVVGSQAAFVSRGEYNVGRDLDLVIRLNMPEFDIDRPIRSSLLKPRNYFYRDAASIVSQLVNPPQLREICRLSKGDPEYRYWISAFVKHRGYDVIRGETAPSFRIFP